MSQQEAKTFWKCGNCGFTLEAVNPSKACPECRQECEFKDVTCYLPECGGPGQIDPLFKQANKVFRFKYPYRSGSYSNRRPLIGHQLDSLTCPNI